MVNDLPALKRLIEEATQSVRDPAQRIPVASAWRERAAAQQGALPTGAGGTLVNNRLGSGSHYTVFLNFLGVPVADLTFDGPYGVYHSIYDNHHWVSRIGDPGFRYHVALVQVWGLMALRLANADVVPLDYAAYAARIQELLEESDHQWMASRSASVAPTSHSGSAELARARAAAARLRAGSPRTCSVTSAR